MGAILAGQPNGATAAFGAAVRRVHELGGQLEYDARDRLVGIDLSSGRVSATDADLACILARTSGPSHEPSGAAAEGGSLALAHLERLRLSGAGISNGGLRQIAAISGLSELMLLDAQINNEGLRAMSGATKLAVLSIRRSPAVTDEGIEYLRRLPALTSLGLLEVGITDQGLAQLATMTRLRALDLRGCSQVGNVGLRRLAAIKGLKVLPSADTPSTTRACQLLPSLRP